MKTHSNIFFLSFFLIALTCQPALALQDSANLALDKLEMFTNDLEALEQMKLSVEKEMEQIKSGVMEQIDMLKSFGDAVKNFDIKRIKSIIETEAGLAKNLNNKDKTAEAVEEVMVPTYGKGKDSDVAYEQNRKRMELLQNNIASLYAHALVIRAEISGKEKTADNGSAVSSENVRELITLNREALIKINKRYNDILLMEAQLLEFEATKDMTAFKKVADDEENTEGDKQ